MSSSREALNNAEQYGAQFLEENVRAVAARLRRMAEEVDRCADSVARVGQPGAPTYGSVASDVHHALAWGFANLNTDQLIRRATDADIARAERRAS